MDALDREALESNYQGEDALDREALKSNYQGEDALDREALEYKEPDEDPEFHNTLTDLQIKQIWYNHAH